MQAYARAYVRAYARIHTRYTYNAHAHAHTLRGVHAITHIHVHFTQAVLARDNCIRLLDTERWTILQRFSGFRCTQQHIRCDLSPDGRVPAHAILNMASILLSLQLLSSPTYQKKYLPFVHLGRFLMSGSEDGEVYVWNVDSGEQDASVSAGIGLKGARAHTHTHTHIHTHTHTHTHRAPATDERAVYRCCLEPR